MIYLIFIIRFIMFRSTYWFLKLSQNRNVHILDFIIFHKIFFSRYQRFNFWCFYFLGFYFDEIFSKILKSLYYRTLLLPGFFFFDKWLTNWIGAGFFRNFLKIFNNFFFFERLDFFFFFISVLSAFMYLFIYLLIIFFLFL